MKENTINFGRIFVLMPFSKDFDDLYKFGVKTPLENIGFICERVDEQHFENLIVERIQNQIRTADYILGITDDPNPNVFYEIGYAHACNKKTILITKQSETIPFDLNQYPHIIYADISDLEIKLTTKFENYKKEPKNSFDPIDSLRVLVSGQFIEKVTFRVKYPLIINYEPILDDSVLSETHFSEIFFEVENSSKIEFNSGFKIGLEIPKGIGLIPFYAEQSYLTNNQMLMIMSKDIEKIYPLCIERISFSLKLERLLSNEQSIKFDSYVHLFTSIGKKDFPLKIEISR